MYRNSGVCSDGGDGGGCSADDDGAADGAGVRIVLVVMLLMDGR